MATLFRKRNMLDAIAIAFILPGGGQVYSGRVKRGFIFLFALFICKISFWYVFIYSGLNLEVVFWLFIIMALGIHLLSVVDAARLIKKTQEHFKPTVFNKWYGYVLYIFMCLIVLSINQIFTDKFSDAFYIPTNAMSPVISMGDRLILNKNIYKVGPINNNDIVVFFGTTGSTYIGRVAAKSSEAIPGTQKIVPEGYIYITPDNKSSMKYDYYGLVLNENIEGKIVFRYWSRELGRIGELD